MAEEIKKISVNAFDKALNNFEQKVVTKRWLDNDLVIKNTLSLSEMLEFVNDVVSSCFQDESGYMPELKEFVIKCNILTKYANFRLPENLEHRYKLVYTTDAVSTVLDEVNKTQFDEILAAISDKIDYLCDSNVFEIEKQMQKVADSFEEMQAKAAELFAGISPEDVGKITKAFADGHFSEEKLVEAYKNEMLGRTDESGEQTARVV